MQRLLGRGNVRVAAVCALMVLGGLAASVGEAHAAPPPGAQALVLDPSVSGGASSHEATSAASQGFTVTVASAAQWAAMTTAEFRAYQLIIIGDPTCDYGGDGAPSLAPAVANAATWEAAVTNSGGNRVLIGTDPTFHAPSNPGAFTLEDKGIAFAGAVNGATGAYVDLSCAYSGYPMGTNVDWLDGLSAIPAPAGSHPFTVTGGPCSGNMAIVAQSGPTAGLTDADLSNWFCSVHEAFDTYPTAEWTPLAVATDFTTPSTMKSSIFCGNDVGSTTTPPPPVCGIPYILIAGAGIVVSSNITLSPASATNPAGTSHTVTATVTTKNPDGTTSPVVGTTVTFTVTSGPNLGATGTCTTNAAGQCTFTYTDKPGGVGTDTITATFTDASGATEKATATKTWVSAETATQLTVNPASGHFHDPDTVSATLTDTATPPNGIGGKTVTFVLNGVESCSGTTAADGTVSCSLVPGEAGSEDSTKYSLAASFAGDSSDLASSGSAVFTVTEEEAFLAYTGQTTGVNGQPFQMSGLLKEDGVIPIGGKSVTFTVGTGSSAQSCSGTTSAAGVASCSVTLNQPGSSLTVPVTAAFDSADTDAFYQPAAAQATARLTYMTGRAYVVGATGLLPVAPTPDTGSIATTQPGTFAPPCVGAVPAPISLNLLCAAVITSPGASFAAATVASAVIGLPLAPVIVASAVQAFSSTACKGSGGATSIAYLQVGPNVIIGSQASPPPNDTINLGLVKIILNEQIPFTTPDGGHGLTVNAVHIIIPGLEDVIISSATSDIHNCPAPS